MNRIDASYRLLLGNPKLVRDLFQGIVNEPWVTELDWSGLRPLPREFVSDSLRQRHSDCIWLLPRARGSRDSVALVLMLEHQSSNDRMMALRLTTYCALLYENLLASKVVARRYRLPLVLPVVLYSGPDPWSAPCSMDELIEAGPPALAAYQLQMRYLLLDTARLVSQGGLPSDNFAALLFRLEHNQGIEDVQDLMQTVWDSTQGTGYVELRRAFAAWARYVLLPRSLPDVSLPAVDTFLEIKTMLTEHSRSWTAQWKAEGLQEGLKKGRKDGARRTLEALLLRKFGTVPAATKTRLSQATLEQLDTWAVNVLDATTLDDVFTQSEV